MKTAREWFQCLRPDLRDRAIKATKLRKFGSALGNRHKSFSDSLMYSFSWLKEAEYGFWEKIYQEALDIEEGRKPDIKP